MTRVTGTGTTVLEKKEGTGFTTLIKNIILFSVADPDNFYPDPDPTSRSGSGSGSGSGSRSEFSPNFLLFFIFLLFYSEFLNLTLFC